MTSLYYKFVNKIIIPLSIIGLPSLSSCQKTLDDDLSGSRSLVVEGWIDSDGHPSLILMRSFSPMDTETTTTADLVVRWATVTISDGEHTESMIGRIDQNIVPPFYYVTAQMKGIPGHTYTITAEYDGMSVTSSCTMPAPPVIDRVDVTPVADSDTLREVSVTFTPLPDCYYHLNVYFPQISGRSLPCFMGTYRPDGMPDGPVTITACRPNLDTDENDYTPYFPVGEKIMVSLTTVTPEVWNFWHQYDDMTAFGGNIFLSGTIPIEGNIHGGYGIWSARGSDSRTVTIF